MSLLIAVDGMGGDNAPRSVVGGMALFYRRRPQVSFLLCGDEVQLRPLVPDEVLPACTFVHTTDVIDGDMKPSKALREQGSSMRLALQAVADGRAAAAISAGNTGAYLALCRLILKTAPGIDRPAIASQVPTLRGESVMLDLGGSLAVSAKNLLDYAVMGDLFARRVLGLSSPSIGLLNVGKEASKGNDMLQEAYCLLKSHPTLNFYGFIEGDDIAAGTTDVVVTDGFTGNVALKMGEGILRMFMAFLKKSLSSSPMGHVAGMMAKPFLKELKEHLDPRCYNGALWLGLQGIAVKSHGGTDMLGFAHALEMAYDMALSDIDRAMAQVQMPMQERA